MQTSDAISAYDKLNASSILYPYSLPFDRYLDITRSYLGFAGVSLYQLEQTFGTFLDAHSNLGSAAAARHRAGAAGISG